MQSFLRISSFIVGFCILMSQAMASDNISAKEYHYFKTYQTLKEAPKLVDLNEKQRRSKIAKHLKISIKTLNDAITKGEKIPDGIETRIASKIEDHVKKSLIGKRLLEVKINTETDQAIAFIKWRANNPLDFDKEACFAALAVKDAGKIVQIAVLWAVNNQDVTVFSSKVPRNVFEKISKHRINSFASTRYIKMFEDVKRGPQI